MAIQNSIQNMYLWVYLFETQKRAGAVCSVDKALGWLLSGCSVDKATQGWSLEAGSPVPTPMAVQVWWLTCNAELRGQ